MQKRASLSNSTLLVGPLLHKMPPPQALPYTKLILPCKKQAARGAAADHPSRRLCFARP